MQFVIFLVIIYPFQEMLLSTRRWAKEPDIQLLSMVIWSTEVALIETVPVITSFTGGVPGSMFIVYAMVWWIIWSLERLTWAVVIDFRVAGTAQDNLLSWLNTHRSTCTHNLAIYLLCVLFPISTNLCYFMLLFMSLKSCCWDVFS